MRPVRAVLAAVALGLVLVAASASPAAAHASLVSVDPPDGARLDESPDVVRLTFSEPVSAELGGVRVLDADGDQVQEGAARVAGAEVEVDLAPDLPDGTYVVSYRVISADGHPVRGGSVFGVGAGEVDLDALGRVAGGGNDRTWEVVGAWGRGLSYAGVLLAAGGVAFIVLVHRGGPERRILVRMTRGGAVIGALASLVALPTQAALGTGQGPGSLFDRGVLGEVTQDGVGAGLVIVVLGLATVALLVERQGTVALVGAVIAITSFATNGHTRAGSEVGLSTAADVVHLLAIAAWGAGPLFLYVVLRRRRADPVGDHDTVALVGRFSTLATAAIVAVGITGATLAWTQVRTVDALTGTGYGRLLLAKVAVVVVIAGLGAYNHLRLVPALSQGKVRAALGQLRATLQLEAVGLLAVIAVTAVLVVVTPGRASSEGGVVERVVPLGEHGSVQLTISPATPGPNRVHLYLFDPDGRPAEIAEAITLELSLPSAQIGPIAEEATRAGPAHLQIDTDAFAVGGTWTIEVRARVDRFTEEATTIEVPIGG